MRDSASSQNLGDSVLYSIYTTDVVCWNGSTRRHSYAPHLLLRIYSNSVRRARATPGSLFLAVAKRRRSWEGGFGRHPSPSINESTRLKFKKFREVIRASTRESREKEVSTSSCRKVSPFKSSSRSSPGAAAATNPYRGFPPSPLAAGLLSWAFPSPNTTPLTGGTHCIRYRLFGSMRSIILLTSTTLDHAESTPFSIYLYF